MSEQTHVATVDLQPTADLQPSPTILRHDRCSACGVPLAADQRYCVECGQRRGASRLPFAEDLVQSERQAPGSPLRARRPRWSVNSTVIACIGTLLLAMGIGVLIGRSGTGSSVESAARPSVQIVTVPGAGAGAATATSTQSSTSTGTTKSAGASNGAASTKSAGTAAKQTVAPPAKAVKVGSPGKGPGYQKGHFTGNFFGE
jgi:hypothetical protein